MLKAKASTGVQVNEPNTNGVFDTTGLLMQSAPLTFTLNTALVPSGAVTVNSTGLV